MKMIRRISLAAGAAALVSAAAFASEAPVAQQPDLSRVAAAARLASLLPGMPLGVSVALDAVAANATPAPAPAAQTRGMKSAAMPGDGMIIVARINAFGELETSCVNTQAAADAFTRGGRPAADPMGQH